jgi:drug/metabolite transporter (DMT)-like permease
LNNLRGIMWMLAAVIALTLMFAIVKQMVMELPVFVVAIMRTAFALVLLVPWMIRVGPPGLKTDRVGAHAFRAFLGASSFVCVVYALSKLLLADAIVLAFTSPLWSILVSAVILGEIAGLRRIAATLVGFIGVLLVVRPHGGIEPATLVALGSALLTSLAMITMKRLTATEPPTRIVFYFFVFATVILLIPAIVTWQTPTPVQWAWLFGAGLLGALGQDWLARAYDAAEVTIVAPLDFLRLPISAVLGFALFHEIPDRLSILGMLIIIAASLYIARRETRATASPPAVKR